MEVDCVDCIAEEDDDGVREQEEVGEAVHRFADLLALWRERRGRRRYLKDWHLPLLVAQSAGSSATAGREKVREELYEVDECWLDDWMNEWEAGGRGKRGGAGQAEACGQGRKEDDFRFVYAGGGDSWTGLHRDVCALFPHLFSLSVPRAVVRELTYSTLALQTALTPSQPTSSAASCGTSSLPPSLRFSSLLSLPPNERVGALAAIGGVTRRSRCGMREE